MVFCFFCFKLEKIQTVLFNSESNANLVEIVVELLFMWWREEWARLFYISQKTLLHQCYVFHLKFLPDKCQNIITKQLNKYPSNI